MKAVIDTCRSEGSARERVVEVLYGGFAFRLRSTTASLELGEDAEGFAFEPDEAAWSPLARMEVSIRVEAADRMPASSLRRPRWTLEGDRGSLEFAHCRAEFVGSPDFRFEVEAATDGTSETTTTLLGILSSLVAERMGGFVLHAVAVELDGRGVLFVGPSGAGKTTASSLCAGARWVSRDRAVVVPSPGGWRAFGIAGGTPGDLPRSPYPHVPVAAVLRIRHGRSVPSLDWHAPARAAFVVRESTFGGVDADEDACWTAIERLIADVPVGTLDTVLGTTLTESLRSRL